VQALISLENKEEMAKYSDFNKGQTWKIYCNNADQDEESEKLKEYANTLDGDMGNLEENLK
jgi:hypothetical protein